MIVDNPRVVSWFSCGAASTIATKLTLEKYRSDHEVVIAYCDTGAEHEDNKRYLLDVQRLLNAEILILKNDNYNNPWEVWEQTGWLVGVNGARCTEELKRQVRFDFQKSDDIQVMGYTAEEEERAIRIRQSFPSVDWEFPLIEQGITKAMCLSMIEQSQIEIPMMYKLGYKNNNCIGCCKGSMGYWNKIRKDFPEVFDRMAKLERRLGAIDERTGKPKGACCCKSYKDDGKRKRIFLDELDPKAGRDDDTVIQCDLLCGSI
jgi:3'-phosphoadenosine 5'-phosphosulfate sulfotransferase (PAPS reductase)/FAD synthetase